MDTIATMQHTSMITSGVPMEHGPLYQLVELMRSQPEWSASHNMKTLSTPSPNNFALNEVIGELKEKKTLLHNLEKRIHTLERERFELDDIVKDEQLSNEQVLVSMLRDKFTRDESVRIALESRIADVEQELDRQAKRIEQEVKLREEALRNADQLRAEVRVLEERIVADEQALSKSHDNERKLAQELEDARQRVMEDEGTIMRLRKNERLMTSDIDTLTQRIGQLEKAASIDGQTIVEMRDNERALRSELDACDAKIGLLDEQGQADEQAFAILKESVKSLHMDNDNLHSQNMTLDAALQECEKLIAGLRDNEAKMKRKIKGLEEVAEEVMSLRHELDRQREEFARLQSGSPTKVTHTTHHTHHMSRGSPPTSPMSHREHTIINRPPSPMTEDGIVVNTHPIEYFTPMRRFSPTRSTSTTQITNRSGVTSPRGSRVTSHSVRSKSPPVHMSTTTTQADRIRARLSGL